MSNLTMTKAPGAATAQFQSALSTRKPINPGTITFVQHHGTLPDTITKTVLLTNAYVLTDRLQTGATTVETVAFAAEKFRLTAASATTELRGNPPNF
jgi:hypothetical protein